MEDLAADIARELFSRAKGGIIQIYNDSDQLIKARIDAQGFDNFIGNTGEFHIHVGSNEKWTRSQQQIVRICAYSSWHDFKVSPGTVIRFTMDHKLQIADGNHPFSWNAKIDGPHI